MDKELTGQVAFVTGASSGLGAHFARLLAGQGAKVGIAARRRERLEDLVAEIEAAGGSAFAVSLDVTDVAAIDPAIDQVEQALGPIDILINNSGVTVPNALHRISEDE